MSAPTIEIWTGTEMRLGRRAAPQRLLTVLGRVTPSSDGAALTCRLNSGRRKRVALGPSNERVMSAGDFLIEIPVNRLNDGSNRLELRCKHGGRTTTQSINISVDSALEVMLPHEVQWSEPPHFAKGVQVVDGRWIRDGDGIRPAEIGYDRLVAIGDIGWSAYEVTVPITLSRLAPLDTCHPAGVGQLFGVLLCWTGHYPLPTMLDRRRRHKIQIREALRWPLRAIGLMEPKFPTAYWLPQGALFSYHWSESRKCHAMRIESGYTGGVLVEDESGYTMEPGSTHVFRCRLEPTAAGRNRHSFKVWPIGAAEPDRWLLQADGLAGELSSGCALLLTHFADVTYGPLRIDPLR